MHRIFKNTSYLYSLLAVTVNIKDQCPIGNKFFNDGDTLMLPLSYAKDLQKKGVINEIQEIKEFESQFNKAITNQSLNIEELIKIDRDFYFLAIDHIKSITNNKLKEKKKKQFKSFFKLRKNILLNTVILGYNQKAITNMAFIERLIFIQILTLMNDFDKQVSYLLRDDNK